MLIFLKSKILKACLPGWYYQSSSLLHLNVDLLRWPYQSSSSVPEG